MNTPNTPPPVSNTGVQPTGTRWGVDWLEYTAPDGTSPSDACPWIPQENWEDVGHGWMGYSKSATAGQTRIAYGGREGMGVHVTLSATALRECVGLWGLADALAPVKWAVDNDFSVSRIDWAGDLFDDATFMNVVLAHLESGAATSRWKTWEPRQKHEIGGKLTPGRTIEFGTRNSDSFGRMYDKKAERAAKGIAMAEELGFTPDEWVRFEVMFRRRNAKRIAELVAAEDWPTLQSVILGLLNIRDRGDGDANVSRWETNPTWAGFIAARVSRTLGLPTIHKTVERFMGWVEHALAPGLSAVLAGSPDAWNWLADAVQHGERRWRRRHVRLSEQSAARLWAGRLAPTS
jgi:phage replication initiation protein